MVYNELVDLDKLIIDYVTESGLRKKKFPNAEKIYPSDISWQRVRIRHDDVKYCTSDDYKKPSASILFSSTFENNTNKPQVYTLKTERTTSSTCTFNLSKAYCLSNNIGLKVTAPYIEAGAGLQRDMTVEKMNEDTFTQQMVWAVDNQVSVPSGYKTKADLVIVEKEYAGTFTMAVHYSGQINVVIRSKNSTGTFSVDVTDIFDEENGFTVNDDVATFICQGSCKCRYGVEQSVKLTQEKIPGFRKLENGIEEIELIDA